MTLGRSGERRRTFDEKAAGKAGMTLTQRWRVILAATSVSVEISLEKINICKIYYNIIIIANYLTLPNLHKYKTTV